MHEMHLDDSLFEDAIIRMRLKQIPKERITTLCQDPEVDRLECKGNVLIHNLARRKIKSLIKRSKTRNRTRK